MQQVGKRIAIPDPDGLTHSPLIPRPFHICAAYADCILSVTGRGVVREKRGRVAKRGGEETDRQTETGRERQTDRQTETDRLRHRESKMQS